jgi:hypothetical protein
VNHILCVSLLLCIFCVFIFAYVLFYCSTILSFIIVCHLLKVITPKEGASRVPDKEGGIRENDTNFIVQVNALPLDMIGNIT